MGMLRAWHSKIILILIFLAYLFLPKTATFGVSYVQLLSTVLILVAILSFINKSAVDLIISLFIFVALVFMRTFYPQMIDIQTSIVLSGILAFLFLSFTLLIGPWARFIKKLAPLLKNRRHIGVATSLLAFTHFYIILTSQLYGTFFQMVPVGILFFGMIALFVLLALAVTSWDFIQRNNNFILWGIVHTLTLVIYWAGFLYFRKNAIPLYLPPNSYTALIIFGLYWLLINPFVARLLKKLFRKAEFINGWKHLHFLVYVAYISVIFHISAGVLVTQPQWIQWTFRLIVTFVLGSHIAGWIRKLNAKKKIAAPANTSTQ